MGGNSMTIEHKPKRILICGSRYFRDAKRIFQYLSSLPSDTIIIEGEARGADTIAWVCCEILGLTYIQFPADWSAYHKAAGFLRNKQMLIEGLPDLVIFYHDDLDQSRGTISMLELADKAKIEVEEGPPFDHSIVQTTFRNPVSEAGFQREYKPRVSVTSSMGIGSSNLVTRISGSNLTTERLREAAEKVYKMRP